MEAFDNTVRDYTTWLDNPYVSGALTIFLIVYASMAAPKLPHYIAKLFDYTLFKLLMFFLIVYISKKNATVALIAAVALMVSIMTLDRLKVGAEMMTIVKGEGKKKVRLGNCSCDCDDVELEDGDNVAQTSEGKMVVAEAKVAVAQGVLHPAVAAAVVQKVVANEAEGKPVLVASTQEGAQRMVAVAKAQSAGTLSASDAKQVAAKIVVHEAVMRSKVEETQHEEAPVISPSMVKTPEAKAVVVEVNKAVASGAMHPAVAATVLKKVALNEAEGKPILATSTQEGAQRMASVAKAQSSGALNAEEAKQLAAKIVVNEAIVKAKSEGANKSEEHVSIAELAEEVIRRKQEETARRGGVAPSNAELRQISAEVLAEYKKASSPISSNISGNSISDNSDVSGNEVSGLDVDASSYASAEHH